MNGVASSVTNQLLSSLLTSAVSGTPGCSRVAGAVAGLSELLRRCAGVAYNQATDGAADEGSLTATGALVSSSGSWRVHCGAPVSFTRSLRGGMPVTRQCARLAAASLSDSSAPLPHQVVRSRNRRGGVSWLPGPWAS